MGQPHSICSVDGCERPPLARGWCNRHYHRWRKHGDPTKTITVEDRFWSKVVPNEDGCWIWIASSGSNGYGQFSLSHGVRHPAHRVAYQLLVGPIASDLEIDHLCRVPRCVNPAHLEPVTPRENKRRSYSPMGLNAAKTHCKYGHPFDTTNTYHVKNGGRKCKTCDRLSHQRRYKPRRNR